MPTFEFELPDRTTVEIQADTLEQAQDAFVQIPGVRGMRESGIKERFTGGFQQSWGDTAYGIKQLAGGDLTPEQQRLIDAPSPQTLPGQLGYMAGEISQLAGPGGPAMSLGRKLIGRWGPAAADVVLNALHGYVKGVSDDESRLTKAGENVLGTAIGRGAVRTMAGVQPTPEAVDMLNRGIRLTPGQAAGKGTVPGMLEQTAEVLPVTGSVIRGMRRRAIKDWNQDELARVAPDGLPPKNTGRKGIGEISDRFNAAYRQLLPDSTSFNADNELTDEFGDILTRYSSVLDPAAYKRLQGNIENVWDMAIQGNLSGANIKDQMKSIRKLITQAMPNDFQLGSAYSEVLDSLKQLTYRTLGPDDARALSALDAQFSGFAPIQEAASRQGALTEGMFTPAQLASAGAGRTQMGRRAAARGRVPMVERALAAEDVLGNAIPPVGPGTGEKIGFLASIMEPGLLIGGTALGAAYPAMRPMMTNIMGRGELPFIIGQSQIPSQAGQILTD